MFSDQHKSRVRSRVTGDDVQQAKGPREKSQLFPACLIQEVDKPCWTSNCSVCPSPFVWQLSLTGQGPWRRTPRGLGEAGENFEPGPWRNEVRVQEATCTDGLCPFSTLPPAFLVHLCGAHGLRTYFWTCSHLERSLPLLHHFYA